MHIKLQVKDFSLSGLKGTIVMEHPNKLIDSFNGVVDLTGLGREPVQPNNLLLRGCFLRNTEWIIGLVVNTGHDTKIMMSMAKTIPKTSDLESKTSKEIGRIVILLALVCFTGATGAAIWNSLNDVSDIWYLQFKPIPVLQWFIDFFYFFLLHATFIPVSLYVSMTIVRYFQSYLMNNDLEMYYERLDLPAQVRTMTLNEELGQVSHIFSDKTGTLTCNIMDFRKASVNGVSYGQGITEIGKAAWKLQNKRISNAVLEGEAKAQANSVPHVTFYDPKYDRDMQAKGVQKEKLQSFFRSLAICHDVVAEHSGDQLRLSASNPDDDALVSAAAYFGYQFCDRREKQCMVFIKEKNVLETIEILRTIPFTSSRKRMSVIIRDSDGLLKIITKGADAIMEHRLKSGQDALVKATNKHMRDYSIEGLRCLLVGSCVLEQQEYHSWTNAYQRASTDIRELEKRKKGENNKIDELEDFIEQNYLLLGCTAIEDRLQDGVPECIAQLAKAGINIWVLTGDKEETAINIAVACNLLLPKEYMDHIIVNNTFAPNDEAMKDLFANEIKVKYNTFLCRKL